MQYVIGVLILGLAWLLFYAARRDLRADMVWSGLYYLTLLSAGFILIKCVAPHISAAKTIVPGYWNPDTLFDLGRITGGYSIEDAFYIFFTGGIAAASYETFFRKKLPARHLKHRPHGALLAGALAGVVGGYLLNVNLIYVLIIFGLVSSLVMCLQRNDLALHCLGGGLAYLLVYAICAFIFLSIFPDYITRYYSLQNLSGVLLFHIPIEEFLFALSFGLSWSPIYEYVRDIR